MRGEQTKCIACAEPIRSGAVICRFCGNRQDDARFLKPLAPGIQPTPTSQPTKAKKKVPKLVIFSLVPLAIAIGIGFGMLAPQVTSPGGVDTESVALPEFSENEAWKNAVAEIKSKNPSDASERPPLDFAASPSSKSEHVDAVREGMELAVKFWGPYLDSDVPVIATLVHPDDKEWFLNRWEETGRDNVGESWWFAAVDTGGMASGWTPEGRPTIYFMAADIYPPQIEPKDVYYEMAMQYFKTQELGVSGESLAPCWYSSGTAAFIGASMIYPTEFDRTILSMSASRRYWASVLMGYFEQQGGLNATELENVVLEMRYEDYRCLQEPPYFGYNLGIFVTEKYLIDFGFDSLLELTTQMGSMELPQAFTQVNGVDYEQWVISELVPYLLSTLPELDR